MVVRGSYGARVSTTHIGDIHIASTWICFGLLICEADAAGPKIYLY